MGGEEPASDRSFRGIKEKNIEPDALRLHRQALIEVYWIGRNLDRLYGEYASALEMQLARKNEDEDEKAFAKRRAEMALESLLNAVDAFALYLLEGQFDLKLWQREWGDYIERLFQDEIGETIPKWAAESCACHNIIRLRERFAEIKK